MKYKTTNCFIVLFLMVILGSFLFGGENKEQFLIHKDGTVTIDSLKFSNLTEYFLSDYFREHKKRCLVKKNPYYRPDLNNLLGTTADCTLSLTSIKSEYWPAGDYLIPIVFHIIHRTDGTGNIPDQRIHDQVRVLNEDWGSIAGTMGDAGFDTKIQFLLIAITRTANDSWYQDNNESGYKSALGWDQDRYLNVYVNTASGYLGYAYYPQTTAGDTLDGVVVLTESVGGRNNGYAPYDQGRTLVHEVGHYLGLLHTFEGCGTGYSSGDLIADTASESEAHYSCVQTHTCGTPDPIHNYMNYTDDLCMYKFTPDQGNRAVCGLVNYRPSLSISGVSIYPPSNVKLELLENNLIFMIEYINRITWQANPLNSNIVNYRLYRKIKGSDNSTFTLLSEFGTNTFVYEDRNKPSSTDYTYKITAVDNTGAEGLAAYVGN